MKILTKEEFLENKEFYLKEIKKGKIFIYPTDTIYGIGCIATNPESILKIRDIKKRDKKPLSIIIPNKKWIEENCEILGNKKYINKLPGPYTFIVKIKNGNVISKKEVIGDLDTIGVRIPNNWFSEFLCNNNIAFITTSVNISGEPPLTNISNLKDDIKERVDYIINEGVLGGKPSRVIDLTKREEEVIRE